jgi:hypothetical protein
MEYPVIDQSWSDRIVIREATAEERRQIRGTRQHPNALYWMRTKSGSILQGIDADGLSKILGGLQWLSDQEGIEAAAQISKLAAITADNLRVDMLRLDEKILFKALYEIDGAAQPLIKFKAAEELKAAIVNRRTERESKDNANKQAETMQPEEGSTVSRS